MKIIIAIWISAIATFALLSKYLLLHWKTISYLEELEEVLSGLGMILFSVLFILTIIALLFISFKHKKEEETKTKN